MEILPFVFLFTFWLSWPITELTENHPGWEFFGMHVAVLSVIGGVGSFIFLMVKYS